ncbi:hypothetical protein ACJX0J_040401, partial [Zea mays]
QIIHIQIILHVRSFWTQLKNWNEDDAGNMRLLEQKKFLHFILLNEINWEDTIFGYIFDNLDIIFVFLAHIFQANLAQLISLFWVYCFKYVHL